MIKPNVTKGTHLLPYGELSPLEFERLCLWLIERKGYLRPEHLGAGGSEQGRDVIAYRATESGEQLWYFQCKRYQTISAATLIKEVEKYNELVKADPTKKPFGIVFVTNAVLSVTAREEARKLCDTHGYKCEFWAQTELDLYVKKHADIVAEFFNVTLPPPLPPTPTDRAWLSVDVAIAGPLVFREGGVDLPIKYIVKNMGRSPANGVIVKAEIIFPQSQDIVYDIIVERQKEICEKRWFNTGITIFHDTPKIFSTHFVLSRQEMEAQLKNDAGMKEVGLDTNTVLPFLVGCVDYAINDSSRHQTGFIYDIQTLDRDGPIGITIGKDIPADHLVLRKFAFGGDFAN